MSADPYDRYRLIARAVQVPPLAPMEGEEGQVLSVGDRVTVQRQLRAAVETAEMQEQTVLAHGFDYAVIGGRRAADPAADRPFPVLSLMLYLITPEELHSTPTDELKITHAGWQTLVALRAQEKAGRQAIAPFLAHHQRLAGGEEES